MIWRFWKDEELRSLLQGFTIDEFLVGPDGKRRIWAQKRGEDREVP